MNKIRYEFKDIEKIEQFSSWSTKQKIDELLRIDSTLYAHLGIDSTKGDKELVRKQSRSIYRIIKNINSQLGTRFLNCMDSPNEI